MVTRGWRNISVVLAWLVAFSWSANGAAASQWALLVGVSDYGGKGNDLEGPVNDVMAIKELLISDFGVEKRKITTLIDRQASKPKIMKALNKLERRSKTGDQIFIYFSGHGTSAGDDIFSAILPTTTGAFIPYDFKPQNTVEATRRELVVGRDDLAPIIGKIDSKQRSVFVVIDACYSGETVRSFGHALALPKRSRPVSAFVDDLAFVETYSWEKAQEQASSNEYPYERVFYLSAAGEHEAALDIPKDRLVRFPTFDQKAHGAFTDTFIRVLKDPATIDVNGNGQIQYNELHKRVKQEMFKRGFGHTPNALPTAAQDKANITTASILGLRSYPSLMADVEEKISEARDESQNPIAARIQPGRQDQNTENNHSVKTDIEIIDPEKQNPEKKDPIETTIQAAVASTDSNKTDTVVTANKIDANTDIEINTETAPEQSVTSHDPKPMMVAQVSTAIQATVVDSPVVSETVGAVLTVDGSVVPAQNADSKVEVAPAPVSAPAQPSSPPTVKDKRLGVSSSVDLASLVKSMHNLRWVEADAKSDIHIERGDQNRLNYLDHNGELVATSPAMTANGALDLAKIKQRLNFQAWLKQYKSQPQLSKVALEFTLDQPGYGYTMVYDDVIGFNLRSELPAKYLMFNINSVGQVDVIYPYYASELVTHKAEQALALAQLGKVVPPEGIDHLKLIAFHNDRVNLAPFMAGSFQYYSNTMDELLELIDQEANNLSQAVIELAVREVEKK